LFRSESGSDSDPVTFVGSSFYGVPRVLEPGDELYVRYSFPKGSSPLSIFLDFGFLPSEYAKVTVAGNPRPDGET